MLKNFKKKIIKQNIEIFSLVLLIIIAVIATRHFNYNKNFNQINYNNFIDNVYLKKSLNHIINNLEPKYKTIKQ